MFLKRNWLYIWLAALIGVGCLSTEARAEQTLATKDNGPQTPAWVVHPNITGDNLPPVGRSLFDFVATKRKGDKVVYDLPFPFEALTKRIQRDASGASLKQVLIPLGRSLQRTAAAPEFFKYPRVVTAVDGELAFTRTSPFKTAPLLLKDRLYLGYQEKADLIEVISYNEAAARFEFQLVKDYRPGGKPKVFYANRAVCMSCHQNGAPIFSRQVWGETNANPKVAALLKSFRREAYGIPVERGVDVPNAIDNATDRANTFAAYQLLWREGCGGEDAGAIRCRVGLFKALLQYKLSGERDFDQSAEYRSQVAERIAANGKRAWPIGLAIGDPDIPNRDPLPGEAGLGLSNEFTAAATGKSDEANARRMLANLSNIPFAFDPLNPRPALEVWPVAAPAHANRAVTGLAAFVADTDVALLDKRLTELSITERIPSRTHRVSCKLRREQISTVRQRLSFDCPPIQNGVAFAGHLEIQGAQAVAGTMDRIRLSGQTELRDVAISSALIKTRVGEHSVSLPLRRGDARVRGADGDAIDRIELTWSAREGSTGDGAVVVRDDFAQVEDAIAQMMDDAIAGRFDGFSAKPFRRASLMSALYSRLGVKSVVSCCLNDVGMPPPVMESFEASITPASKRLADPDATALRPFYHRCASCHQTADRVPPNFLVGAPDRVRENLAHCAERMFVRLSMWRVAPEARGKSPMPPVNAVHGAGYSSDAWRNGADLMALQRYVENVLKEQTGRAPSIEEMMGRGYENLRGCLPGPV
ncbi:MAG TPA: hypothetical protein VM532_17885 [Burkholderiales bacterium]|nr:hypothetical protein [Burkholderiales bacterium]